MEEPDKLQALKEGVEKPQGKPPDAAKRKARRDTNVKARADLSRFLASIRIKRGIDSRLKLGKRFDPPLKKATITAYEDGSSQIPFELWPQFRRALDMSEEEYIEFIKLNLSRNEAFEMASFCKEAMYPFTDLIHDLIALICVFRDYPYPLPDSSFRKDCTIMKMTLDDQIKANRPVHTISLHPGSTGTKSIVSSEGEILGTFTISGKSYSVIPTPPATKY
jgi:hypothetical protein